jgi:protein translocase SecG subunit
VNPLLLAAAKALPQSLKTVPQSVNVATPAPVAVPMPLTALQVNAPWLTHTIAGVGVVAAIALIVLLAVQTTKQEGLSGTIGGRVESAYRGRPGAEEQLKRITGVVVGVWLVAYLVLSISGI